MKDTSSFGADAEAPSPTALKPCPFCSGESGCLRGDHGWRVWCLRPGSICGVIGPFKDTESDAIVAWNRHSSPSRDAVIEECAQICDRAHRANLHSIGISMASDARAMMSFKLAEAIRALKAAAVIATEEQGSARSGETRP